MNLFEEMLSEQVRLHRHLSDPSMLDHRDRQVASNSWREIATVVGKEEMVCKEAWKNLRDKFAKGKKRLRGDPGGLKRVSPTLPELGWLSQIVKQQETDSNMDKEEGVALNDRLESSITESCSSSSSSTVPSVLPVSPVPLNLSPTCITSPYLDAFFPQSILVRSPTLLPVCTYSARKRKKPNTEDVLLKKLGRLDL